MFCGSGVWAWPAEFEWGTLTRGYPRWHKGVSGAAVSSEAWLGKYLFLSSHGVGSIQLLMGCWIEDLSFFLDFGWRLSSAPYHVDLPSMATCFFLFLSPSDYLLSAVCVPSLFFLILLMYGYCIILYVTGVQCNIVTHSFFYVFIGV